MNILFNLVLSVVEAGLVLSCIDGIGRLVGIDAIFIGELLALATLSALVLNIEFIITGVSILGNDYLVEQADVVERTFAELLISVGFFLIGRIIDPTANFLDV
jgi:F-type H+-transporting ATPase subunit alpha